MPVSLLVRLGEPLTMLVNEREAGSIGTTSDKTTFLLCAPGLRVRVGCEQGECGHKVPNGSLQYGDG